MAAAERVKVQLKQAVDALEREQIPHSVVGGNAVAEWVKQLDDEADRSTRDVDLLIRRSDEFRVKAVLSSVELIGHVRRPGDASLIGDARLPRNTVYLLFEKGKFLPDDPFAMPTVEQAVEMYGMPIVDLIELVRMKLTAYRTIDQVHLLDLIHVGQIDQSWPARFPPPLADRLQELIDNPDS